MMKKMLKRWHRLKNIAAFGRLRIDLMILSFLCLVIAAALEGVSFGLLVPFLKQAAGLGTYEGWRNLPLVGGLLQKLNFDVITHRIEWLLVVIVCAVTWRVAMSYASAFLFYSATIRFEAVLRVEAYKKVLNYGCIFFDGVQKGEIHNVLMRFTQEVSDLMKHFFGLCTNALFVFIYLVVLLNVSLSLSLTAIAVAPIFYLLLKKIFRAIQVLFERILKNEQSGHAGSLDVFSNIKLIKAMGLENDAATSFGKSELCRAKDSVAGHALSIAVSPLQEILMTLGIALIIWISMTYYFKDDSSFLIKLLVSLLLFRRALGGLAGIFGVYPQVIRRIPFVQKFDDLISEVNKEVLKAGDRKLNDIRQGITYSDVTMCYEPNRPVLNNISFYVPAGSFTAIVGASGSGKSTLVELLPRFYEHQKGEIIIDGVPIREFSVASLRRAIGFVSQDTLVLNDTIYNNIIYAKSNATESEVLEVAEHSKVLDFTKNFPDGLHTNIGDKGVKLSGGELQRLAIARVMLRKPQILILDEATSALDSVSECMIQEALSNLTKGRTTIAVAHRLSTIRHADQILVINQGRIVERGSMEELQAHKGLFYQYWQAQNQQNT